MATAMQKRKVKRTRLQPRGTQDKRKATRRFSICFPADIGHMVERFAAERDMELSKLFRKAIDAWVTENGHELSRDLVQQYRESRHLFPPEW